MRQLLARTKCGPGSRLLSVPLQNTPHRVHGLRHAAAPVHALGIVVLVNGSGMGSFKVWATCTRRLSQARCCMRILPSRCTEHHHQLLSTNYHFPWQWWLPCTTAPSTACRTAAQAAMARQRVRWRIMQRRRYCAASGAAPECTHAHLQRSLPKLQPTLMHACAGPHLEFLNLQALEGVAEVSVCSITVH